MTATELGNLGTETRLQDSARFKEAKSIVQDELFEAIRLNPLGGYTEYFNNFHLRLPEGGSDDEILHRTQFSSVQVSEDHGNSPKRAGESGTDFFKNIDQTVFDLGIDIAEIRRLKDLCREHSNTFSLTKLYMLTFDTFVLLRALGYNHHDLTS